MVPEENPATDGGGGDRGAGPPGDDPQAGQDAQGTDAPDETAMELDQQAGPEMEVPAGAIQASPIGLPPLERRRQMEIVSTVAQISLLARALGGISADRGSLQTGQSEGSQPQEHQAAQTAPTPQEEIGQRSDSQDFIPLSFAQAQTAGEEQEAGELPITREQMRQAGALLQERVTQEQQRQQTIASTRRHAAITAELSTERQARQTAERRLAELEAQMAGDHPPTQRVETQTGVRGRQTAPMLPRPLQIGGVAQRPMQGGRPQTAMPTYS